RPRPDALQGAALRAVSGVPTLDWRGRQLLVGRRPWPLGAPHLRPFPGPADLRTLRGATDAVALRHRHSDAASHRRRCPSDALAHMVFELLEQLRCESLVPAGLPGVRRNMRRRFEAWSQAYVDAGRADSASGLLLFTAAQVCRAHFSGDPVPEAIADRLEATRAGLAPRLGVALAGMQRERAHQAGFAVHARAYADAIAGLLRQAGMADAPPPPDEAGAAAVEAAAADFQFVDLPPDGQDAAAAGELAGADAPDYRVYTRAYDREDAVETLVRAQTLRELRLELDQRVARAAPNVARLARELQALYARPQPEGHDGAQEEGRIDGRRIALLITSPSERELFMRDRLVARADACVTVLLDCSGSMKEHMERLAVRLDVLLRALDLAGIESELLGYTTAAWNGGRCRRDWSRSGRPRQPGRLNERQHLVFKSGARSWRRSRAAIAALLRPELFREGLDGEAIAWACARLRAHAAARRVLLLVGDGAAHDAATVLANDPWLLEQHRLDTLAREQGRGDVEILALGLGAEPVAGCARTHSWASREPSCDADLRGLLAALAQPPHGASRR
ncbi:MAG: cobalt chelatase, partial [Burkholderiales bacterium]|nr:cobalt chelatase [Burkholderiales bacterium]